MMKKTTLMIALTAMTLLEFSAAAEQTILPCPENATLKWRMEGPAKVLEDGSVELVSSGMAERPDAIYWMPLRSGEKYVVKAEMKGENIGKKQHESHGIVLGIFVEIDGKWQQLGEKITLSGTFPWHPFTSNVTIPAEFKGSSGNLIIGLFNVAGKLHVRNVRITKLD